MGNRAIYILREKGDTSYFIVHHEANALSPLLRLKQAQEDRERYWRLFGQQGDLDSEEMEEQ